MSKNGMRPVHPGEILREDYLIPLDMSANALAKALNVPAPRINDIVRERRGVTRGHRLATDALLWRRCALMAEFAGGIRIAGSGNRKCQAH